MSEIIGQHLNGVKKFKMIISNILGLMSAFLIFVVFYNSQPAFGNYFFFFIAVLLVAIRFVLSFEDSALLNKDNGEKFGGHSEEKPLPAMVQNIIRNVKMNLDFLFQKNIVTSFEDRDGNRYPRSTSDNFPIAIKYLSLKTVTILLDAGADPNMKSDITNNPILFDVIGTAKDRNDIAMLLIAKGADVNARNSDGLTPVMFAATNASTDPVNNEVWSIILYILENTNCDFTYSNNGNSLQKIISQIRRDAIERMLTIPADFNAVIDWLNKHQIDTMPGQSIEVSSAITFQNLSEND